MTSLPDQQAALVRALVAGADVPAGFDPGRIEATRRALLRKRAGDVAAVWPTLLADRAARNRFVAWADGRPKTSSYGDGLAFARHEHAAGRLSDAAESELHERAPRPRWSWRRRARRQPIIR